jgi:putative ABC transport system permease protein
VANLQAQHALILIVLSTLLTILGGHIPAIMASKKEAVDALRSE